MAREKKLWSKELRKSGDETIQRCQKMGVRELIIVVGAEIDAAIGELISKRLRGEAKVVEKFLNGPLGNFGNRIDLALMLGLIDGMDAKALHALQELRNVAAHHVEMKVGDPSFQMLENQLNATWVGIGGMMAPVSGQSDELRIREVLTAILLVFQHTIGQLLPRVMPVADLTGQDLEED